MHIDLALTTPTAASTNAIANIAPTTTPAPFFFEDLEAGAGVGEGGTGKGEGGTGKLAGFVST
jgi:hypothetical protein